VAHQACLLLFTSPTSLSKISTTYSPITRFTAPCGRPSASLHIWRHSHLPARTAPCVVHFSLLPVPHAHPRLSLLAPAVPPAVQPPAPLALAPSGALPASADARGAVARLRSVPARAKGIHERAPCWWCSHPEAGINRP
jgi:hypothetical protein